MSVVFVNMQKFSSIIELMDYAIEFYYNLQFVKMRK